MLVFFASQCSSKPMRMKNLLLAILLAFTAGACVTLEYQTPQPLNETNLNSIPYFLQGYYLDENNDTLVVTDLGFQYQSEASPLSSEAYLSDTLIVRPFKNCYTTNIAIESSWLVYLICRQTNGDLLLYTIDVEKEDVVEQLKSITKVITETDDSGQVSSYLINPSEKEFNQLYESGLFEKSIHFRRIVPEDDK